MLTTRCKFCGRELTSPASQLRGYGEECGIKNGLKLRPRRRPSRPAPRLGRIPVPEGYDWRAGIQRYLRG